jgi:hypothetical protein
MKQRTWFFIITFFYLAWPVCAQSVKVIKFEDLERLVRVEDDTLNVKKVKSASFLALLLAFCIQGTAFIADGYKVGDEVQDFSLKGIDGKMVSLGGQKDVKGYIIAFTCNTCPVAKAYEDRIIALNEKYASRGYPVIAIQPNDVNASPGDLARSRLCSNVPDRRVTHFHICRTRHRTSPGHSALPIHLICL